jgi:Leucine-rich repeat (LRR) protein
LKYFRSILLSLICLMTGAALGRELECFYNTQWAVFLWPEHGRCYLESVDFSAKFEAEKHSFTGSASEKSKVKTFEIEEAKQVDFIPLEIVTEFPNLNGIVITESKVPTVKSGLFKPAFENIEYLDLSLCNIKSIEANAFQYLIKLKYIRLYANKLSTLPDQVFGNNPGLLHIDLRQNQLSSIVPNFFDGLNKLKLVYISTNLCIEEDIGCETCLVGQADLKSKLQKCFGN